MKESLTDEQTLNLLFPGHQDFLDQLVQVKQTNINVELMAHGFD